MKKIIQNLNEDETELLNMLIIEGIENVICSAKDVTEENNDLETYIRFLLEIQCLLEKLGYEFKFKIKEIKENEM